MTTNFIPKPLRTLFFRRFKHFFVSKMSSKQKTLFLLDEPTTGLHCEEVGLLLNILRELVSKGHTVVVIEHNLDVMCRADTIIDFGPGGGTAGGTVVARGTVQEVCESKSSITGQCLKTHLDSNL